MKYLSNITNLDELKIKFRQKALILHPDKGGSTEEMQILNAEYDVLLKIFSIMNKITKEEKTTAQEYKTKFYTQNGWEGKNYKSCMSTKEITKIIRDAIKEIYPLHKFSVSFESYSGGSSIYISLMEAPTDIFNHDNIKYNIELAHNRSEYDHTYKHYENNINKIIKEGYTQSLEFYSKEKSGLKPIFTDETINLIENILRLIDSYRMDDSESQIDYFDTNFYYHFDLGQWNKPFKIVEKTPVIGKQKNFTDKEVVIKSENKYDIKEDTDTRDNSKIFVVKIVETLTKEMYVEVNNKFKSIGGYYSKFKHGFIFKNNPEELLKTI